ncbi:BRO-N domain-containing protein [Desulfobotulus mexicanus]|nr:BRO family protein [Desulfobotulus mexicanus]
MENNLPTTNFIFQNCTIRTLSENGEIWFVAKDVCEALGISWTGKQTLASIPDEWKGLRNFLTPSSEDNRGGGEQG